VIELKNYRLSELKELLPRYLTDACHLTSEELYAIQNDRKSQHRILLVLDGFDELKQEPDSQTEAIKGQFRNCVETCGAEAWFAGQIKVVVTCRVRHLPDTSTEQRYFGFGARNEYRRRVMLPFSSAQIATYLIERTGTMENHLLSADTYLSVMAASPSIKAMVRNPFVLRLFTDALPELQKQGRVLESIKRYDIYKAFVTQWFVRETARLPAEIQGQLEVAAVGSSWKGTTKTTTKDMFEWYAATLANEMYRQDSLVVRLNTGLDSPAVAIWQGLEARVVQGLKERVAEHLTIRYRKSGAAEKVRLETENITDVDKYFARYHCEEVNKALHEVTTALEAFKVTSPLKQQGDVCSFIHKSFYEFFLAQAILHSAGADLPLSARVAQTLTCLSAAAGHELRRIQQEPQTLLFLQDIWIGNSTDPLIKRVIETLFAVIDVSKGLPEHGPAAANAITLLNWMETRLEHQSWKGIQIPGANLAYAFLTGSCLSGANLRGVKLFRANLQNVSFSRADLTNVNLAEYAPIAMEGGTVIAHDPTQRWFAVCNGKNVFQYDTERNGLIREPMIGHSDEVFCGAYSPDGKLVASGSDDKTIRQWVVASGEPFGPVLVGHSSWVNRVAYSPNGKLLASGSDDETIRQWDVATGEPFGPVLVGHTSWVSSVVYSPDGKLLASGSEDETIRQWDVATGEPFGPVLVGHISWIRSVAYSPDGKLLASGSDDKTIRQWDVATGEPFGPVFAGYTSCVNSVAYSPDGKLLVSGCLDKTIRQWDVATGEPFGPVLVGHTSWVRSVAYSSDGQYLISGGDDGLICMWTSGVYGDFSLLWSTRSAATPLRATGLRLAGAHGLRADQLAMLKDAGYVATNDAWKCKIM
jgi:hypothetical protein